MSLTDLDRFMARTTLEVHSSNSGTSVYKVLFKNKIHLISFDLATSKVTGSFLDELTLDDIDCLEQIILDKVVY